MRQEMAFIKKEWLEFKRSGKIWILVAIFFVFGLMNPAIAKLTPEMIKMFADQLESQGMVVKETTITALDSWMQFYKNISMLMIVFVCMLAGIMTNEFQKNTLVLVVTKGLSKTKIFIAKLLMICLVWTIGYAFMTGVTWFYTSYYWDNSIANNLMACILATWLYGIMLCAAIMFFSSFCTGMSGVLIGTAAVVFLFTIISMIPNAGKLMPTALASLYGVIAGTDKLDIAGSLIVTVCLSLAFITGGILIFKNKQI